MMKHFENYGVLNDSQHGFRAKRSTETQLILTIHDIASSIQQNQSIHAIVLDFTKAFDKVPHQRLLKKMEYYGIRGPLLNWFTSFLFERQQTVICEGRSSMSATVSSGVPQGTVLAPLLFLLYINDLPDSINSTVRLFADDALLYGVISNDADGDQIQNDLIRLEQWQTIWQMNFNPAKCKVICFSTKRDPPKKVYKLCGVILEEVQSIPYLGLTLDKKLKWSNHIQNITTNANRTLGLMRRNFWNCPREIKEITYKTLVIDLNSSMPVRRGTLILRKT